MRPLRLLAAVLLLASCTDNTIIGGGGGGPHDFVYTATVSGTDWTASSVSTVQTADLDTIRVLGSQTKESLQITVDLHIKGFNGVGTYGLGDLRDGSYAIVIYSRVGRDSTTSYATNGVVTGSVNISAYNPHSGDAEATFHFDAAPATAPLSGFPDTVRVTAGRFAGALGQ